MSDDFQDRDDRGRDLAAFANAGGQPNQPVPSGHSLVRPTSGVAERVIGAQPVAVYRDEAKILQKLTALAAAAGEDWFYRFPVRKQGGGQDWIEGPSIKLANDVARIFGNDAIEVREIDVGDAFVFYARFTDIETGFSMERAYRQRKSQTSMKTKDADRQLDIAYQIGQSKAIRNVIVNSLQIYADHAFREARNSLVGKIGKDIVGSRARIIELLKDIDVPLIRAERAIGRPAKDWLAPDIARLVAMWKSVDDNMASASEVFPPVEELAKGTPAAEPAAVSGGAQETSSTVGESESPAAADAAAVDHIGQAYEKGKQARAAGAARKAIPGEYRDAAHSREAIAWAAGFDGGERPTFPEGK